LLNKCLANEIIPLTRASHFEELGATKLKDPSMKVITIDGPAGSGKSTVAKQVAQQLGWTYLTTGAIYRSLALLLHESGCSLKDRVVLRKFMDFLCENYRQESSSGQVFLGERDVTFDVRLPQISELSSIVAQDAQVRAGLLPLQRLLVQQSRGAVVDGRDMGTIVFPDAKLKIFLTASPTERARRRASELTSRGSSFSFEEMVKEIEERDFRDANRELAPLVPAQDAIVLDSSTFSIEQVVTKVLSHFKERSQN
jgi:cytidylate kinase